jgi:ATP-dependent Zn protease
MSAPPQDTLTAWHEAGHAVIALMLGRAVHEVSILPGGKRLGYCEMRKGGRPPKDALEADLLILLAGMAAEAKISGHYGLDGASQDLQMAERLALSRAGNARQAQRLLERMLDKVEHLMSDDATWSAIDLIATELLKSRFLSGRAARHFHEQAMARAKK